MTPCVHKKLGFCLTLEPAYFPKGDGDLPFSVATHSILSSIFINGQTVYQRTMGMALLIIAGCITAVLYLAYEYFAFYTSRRNFIQSQGCQAPSTLPHKDPLFGLDAVRDTFCAIKEKRSIARQIELYTQYGSTFSSKFFMTPVISTIEPENIKTVLSSRFEDYGVGSRRKNAFAPLLGRSIFQVDGPQWKHSRSLLQSCFTSKQAENLQAFDVHVSHLVKALSAHESCVDLGDWFPRLTADVTTDCFFGTSIGSLDSPSSLDNMFVKAIHEAQSGCEKRWILGPLAAMIPDREFSRNVRQVHDFIDEHVKEAIGLRSQSRSTLKDGGPNNKRHVFLHELSTNTDDPQVLRDELLTIFFAGVDATAALLTNLFFVLAKRPDIWRLLRQEVVPLRGGKPDIGQLRSLRYHHYCIKECETPHCGALSPWSLLTMY